MIAIAQSRHDLALCSRPHPSTASVGLQLVPDPYLQQPHCHRQATTVHWSEEDRSSWISQEKKQLLALIFARLSLDPAKLHCIYNPKLQCIYKHDPKTSTDVLKGRPSAEEDQTGISQPASLPNPIIDLLERNPTRTKPSN